MKQMHYKVVLRYMEYREPYPDLGVQDSIVYESLEEIFQKFPSFQENLEPGNADMFLVGDMYHGIYLSRIQLTYDDIDEKRPTEKELHNYYIENDRKKYKNYF